MFYLDTGCLVKLYYPGPESEGVAKLVSNRAIALVALHELELYDALELELFAKRRAPSSRRP